MKKEYITPYTIVIKIETNGFLASSSIELSVDNDKNDYVMGD